MDYSISTQSPPDLTADCLISGVFAGNKLSPSTAQLDQASGGAIARLLKNAHLDKPGDSLLLQELAGIKAKKLLLVCLGPKKEFKPAAWRKALASALGQLQKDKSRQLASTLGDDLCKGLSSYASARDSVLLCAEATYRADSCKSAEAQAKAAPKYPLQHLCCWAADAAAETQMGLGLKHGQAIAQGVNLAKDLANLPGNICTPSYLAEQAKKLAKQHKALKLSVLEEADMEKLGMGSLLSVSRGSRQPAKLIIMEYKGAKASAKPIALVGKGLTFDAGGISLKPGAGMDEMKYDMCGGASVIACLQAAAELELPLNLVGLVPASENLPDGAANKPGDIVTSLSGQTIEILNTDAEGRLILCDTLTYAERFEPAAVIDIATLTGACIIALGDQASGLLANHQELADELLAAGQASNDRAWQLPLWEEYQKQLDSPFADMANIGGKGAGTITAACFLSRFAKKFHWAHLDIAGTAWKSGENKGATGRPVPLLMEFLLQRAGQK
ncbi:MAG: leucyl aminopeptidase [Gammaproteobacteria bacterium]|nr:leucyl aminopeptidase [Gammaproteobacteria bacterium]